MRTDSEIGSLPIRGTRLLYPATRIIAKAINRMGAARRCNLVRLFLTLQRHQVWQSWLLYHHDGIQILTRVSESILFH